MNLMGYPLHSGPAHILWSLTSNASEWGGENRLWAGSTAHARLCPRTAPLTVGSREEGIWRPPTGAQWPFSRRVSQNRFGPATRSWGYLSQMDTPLERIYSTRLIGTHSSTAQRQRRLGVIESQRQRRARWPRKGGCGNARGPRRASDRLAEKHGLTRSQPHQHKVRVQRKASEWAINDSCLFLLNAGDLGWFVFRYIGTPTHFLKRTPSAAPWPHPRTRNP